MNHPTRDHRSPGAASRFSRRAFIGFAAAALATAGCGESHKPPLRVGAHPWPGYEMLYLARQLGLFDASMVRLIETTSASASISALALDQMEGACLTLDELLTVREEGVPLTAVLVMDYSMGADVVLGRDPGLDLEGIRGKRVGVENSAVGAVMLNYALKAAALTPDDITLVYLSIDRHEDAYVKGQVDVLVTYEPVKARLLARGARQLFSSADVPGKIIDLLAVRQSVIEENPQAVQALVSGFFGAQAAWADASERHAGVLGRRLGLDASQVNAAFSELRITGREDNRQLLSGAHPPVLDVAESLGERMLEYRLLPRAPSLARLVTDRFMG